MLRRVALVRTDVRRLLVTAVVPSSPILVTLMKEALRSTETSVLHSYRREKLKSYISWDDMKSNSREICIYINFRV
jgi:hypothetical protein